MFERLGNIPSEYSYILKNNTGNQALKGTASLSAGQGTVSIGSMQTVLGRYNNPDQDDMFQIGGGESDAIRRNAFKIDGDRIAHMSGGDVFMEDTTTDTRLPVIATINGQRMLVRLKDSND